MKFRLKKLKEFSRGAGSQYWGGRLAVIPFILLCSFLISVPVYAVDASDPNVGEGISIARCVEKGNLDFLLFLNTFIYSDGLKDGLIEPFNDVLKRNQCQATDISSLINQQDKIRQFIRDAFLTCRTERLPGLEKAFNELSIEIYYVRHVIDGNVVFNLPYELLSTRMLENKESLYYPREKLKVEMADIYVYTRNINGTINQKDFDLLFDRLEFKYSDRKDKYVICENSSWDVVAEKWDEFVSTWGGTAPALKRAQRGIGGRVEKIGESLDFSSMTNEGLLGFLSGFVQVNINGMEAKAGIAEIQEELDKYIPNLTGPTQQSDLYQAQAIADRVFDISTLRNELSSNFAVLYKETSDEATRLLIEELDSFNKTITDSFTPMEVLTECSSAMNDRQCPGKFIRNL